MLVWSFILDVITLYLFLSFHSCEDRLYDIFNHILHFNYLLFEQFLNTNKIIWNPSLGVRLKDMSFELLIKINISKLKKYMLARGDANKRIFVKIQQKSAYFMASEERVLKQRTLSSFLYSEPSFLWRHISGPIELLK